MKVKSDTQLSIFDTFKTKGEELTGEANRQRAIIRILASDANPADRTRTAISQKIAKNHGIVWKNIYSGIFRDLDEILLPLELVEEAGRLPLKRGPKALQEKGIPFYQLTKKGILVALSIGDVSKKEVLLSRFFQKVEPDEKGFEKILLGLSEISPKFTYSIFQKYVKAYCEKKIELMPFNLSKLKKLEDDSFVVQKEILKAFMKLNRQQREDTISLLNEIT